MRLSETHLGEGNLLQQELRDGAAWVEETTVSGTPSLLGGLSVVSGGSGTLGWDVGLLLNIPDTHQRPEGPSPTPTQTPDCSTPGHTKETPRIVGYCRLIHPIIIYSGANLGSSSLPRYSRTPEGEAAQSLGRTPEAEGAESRLVSCFVTETFYQRETQMC